MKLSFSGGVSLPLLPDAWKHKIILPNAGQVFLHLSQPGSYTLHVSNGSSVKIGTLIATLSDNFPVYSSVSGTYNGVFSYHNECYAGITDDGKKQCIPVLTPERRAISSIPREELAEHLRLLSLFDIRNEIALYNSILSYHQKASRIIIDLTDDNGYSFTNYFVSLNKASSVLNGAKILSYILDAPKIILVLNHSQKKPIESFRKLINDSQLISLASIDVKYPVNDFTLLESIYGKRIDSKDSVIKEGYFIVDGQTSASVFECLLTGIPHCERILTVSGDGVGLPSILTVPFGTTWKEILNFSKFKGGAYEPKINNPIVGRTAHGVCQGNSTSLIVSIPVKYQETSCIACGNCISACPIHLIPNKILSANDYRSVKYLATHCIQCGCCSYVCPSNIPLHHQIHDAMGSKGGN